MEYIPAAAGTVGRILCCECGIPIEPNPTNTCVTCLRSQTDITAGIPRSSIVNFCKGCERYMQPPAAWIKAELESRELLTLLIKKLKGTLTNVRLTDASFIWTEPHSKRIKIKLTVQKEIQEGAVLEQLIPVILILPFQNNLNKHSDWIYCSRYAMYRLSAGWSQRLLEECRSSAAKG